MAQEQSKDQWQDLVTDIDAFWNEELQKSITGKLVGITQMVIARRDTQVGIIVLSEPATGVKGSKESKEEIKLEPGEAIGVVIKHKLRDLYSMVENQCMVQIGALGKIPLDNGNSMWRYKVRFRGRRTLNAAPPPAQDEDFKEF